jgi:diguanylate cyclase
MRQTDDDIKNEIKTANLIAKRILPEMAEKAVPVIPENYQVWFEYAAGTNPELSDEISHYKASETTFSRETNQHLYNKYFGTGAQEEFQKHIQKQTQHILKSALNEFLIACDATSDYRDKLDEYTHTLSEARGLSEIRLVIERILKDTFSMNAATKGLQDELDDATKRAESLQEKLERTTREALRDPLTGLHNRKAFEMKIDELLQEYQNRSYEFAVLMLDIDHFKAFNDQYGHQIGDDVLKLVGSLLIDTVKGRDYPARYGGEEFIVLLPQTDRQGAAALAEQIREQIAQKKLRVIKTGESLPSITVSIGVSTMHANDSMDSLVHRADEALYLAKHAGRNCVKSEQDLPQQTAPISPECLQRETNVTARPS